MSNFSKTVLITGASKGIGKATAELFALNNYNVLINYNKSYNDALELYNYLLNKECQVKMFKADVSKRDEVEKMMRFCFSEFKGIDILINNAGISQSKLFIDITENDWDTTINVNLKGAFNCSQSALEYMIPQKSGKIINISSIWGIVGASCEVHYSVSKAGLIGLTKALAKELGPSNIQVNCIAPGIIKTSMLDSYNAKDIYELIDKTPLLRLGEAKDIASCALYLASEAANFITGQVISPNGGFTI